MPATVVPLRPLSLSCAPTASAFEELQDELRTLVRQAGGTFAGEATVAYRKGRLHLRATVMLWPGAIPAGNVSPNDGRHTSTSGPLTRSSSVPPLA